MKVEQREATQNVESNKKGITYFMDNEEQKNDFERTLMYATQQNKCVSILLEL